MSFRPRSAVVWFAVGGGPIAFALQFVAGLAFSFAQCNQSAGRWRLPVQSWQAALAAGALALGLASMGTAAWLFFRTFRIDDVFEEERSGGGSAPPIGRIHFLAIVGLVVNFLALAIIVMDGVGTPLLSLCQQS
jgi:hypothetical protein